MTPLCGSTMLAEGRVNMISLEAIAARLGARWEIRRDAIHEHAQRTLERHLGGEGRALRLSETDYLIIQPALGRFAGQLRCLHALREILTYFLGQAQMTDLDVREIIAIAGLGMETSKVDAAALTAASERAEEATRADPGGDQWSPFVASNGHRVRVSCTLEPVFELKSYSRIGYRVARRVLRLDTDQPLSAAEHGRLSRSDMERIDFATIARGLDRLSSDAGGEVHPSLIIPVSYISLSSQRSRTVLIGLFQKAKQAVERGLICEVCDIDGVPPAALLTAVSFIKPYCLFVVGRCIPTASAANLRGAGLQAISMEADPALESEAEVFNWAKKAVAAAKTVAKSVMIYDLPNARGAALAASVGATHASLRSAQTRSAPQ